MREERLGMYIICAGSWLILIAVLLMCISVSASTTGDAVETALKAAYEQSGVKDNVEDYGKRLQKQYIAKEHERYWAALVYVADALVHYEIRVKLTF